MEDCRNITWAFTSTHVRKCVIRENYIPLIYFVLRFILGIYWMKVSIQLITEIYVTYYHSLPCSGFLSYSDILKTLDTTKYARFNKDPNAVDANRFNIAADINDIKLLVDYKYCMTYSDYKAVNSTKFLKNLLTSDLVCH